MNLTSLAKVSRLSTGALALFALFPCPSNATDWPQWRGPTRDGIWRESGILTQIPPGGLRIRWRAPIGQGYSGPAVAEGKVYLTDRKPHPDRERILCFEEATGEPLWEHAHPCEYAEMEYGNGPRTTPTVHDGRVYTLGTKGHLLCLDAVKGEVIWRKDLVREFGAREPRYGISAAPVVEEHLLIVCVGALPDASVVAFDRKSGEERWRSMADRPGYSAPVVIDHAGVRQLIAWTAEYVCSLNPLNGEVYWKIPFKVTFDDAQVVASPVLLGDRLLCLASWGRGSMMLRLDPGKPAASIEWETRKDPTTMFSTPWFPEENHFYAIVNDGGLACLKAATGEEVWKTMEPTGERTGNAHLTPVADADGVRGRVFLFNQNGHLILAKLSPEGYEELGRTLLVEATAGHRPQGPVTWAHPAYANRSIFARNDRDLVCASLAADDAPGSLTEAESIEARVVKGTTGRDSALGLSVSPDGSALAVGTWIGNVRIIELATDSALPAPKKHRNSVTAVTFSRDGKRLVSGGGNEFLSGGNNLQKNAEMVLWDIAEGKELSRIAGHEDKIYTVAFSPDGRIVASGSADKTIRLWEADAGTLKERVVLKGHEDAVSALAFSPDGNTLVSAGWDGAIRFWDGSTGADRGRIEGHREPILSLAFSPDGKRFATGSADWTVRLWASESRESLAVLEGHRGAVYSVAFSPDGSILATGSGDETVRLWKGGEEWKTLKGTRSGVSAVLFLPDGKSLIGASRDDGVKIWKLPAADG